MRSFKDNEGREWTVLIEIDTIRRVRSEHGIDLAQTIRDQSILERLSDDVVLLCDVLYSICRPQADNRKLTAEDFGRALYGDAIASATEAFMGGIIDFFPPEKRRLLQQVADAGKNSEAEVMTTIQKAIDNGLLDVVSQKALNEMNSKIAKMMDSDISTTTTKSS